MKRFLSPVTDIGHRRSLASMKESKLSALDMIEFYEWVAKEIRLTFQTIQKYRENLSLIEFESKAIELPKSIEEMPPLTRKKAEQLLIELARRASEKSAPMEFPMDSHSNS